LLAPPIAEGEAGLSLGLPWRQWPSKRHKAYELRFGYFDAPKLTILSYPPQGLSAADS